MSFVGCSLVFVDIDLVETPGGWDISISALVEDDGKSIARSTNIEIEVVSVGNALSGFEIATESAGIDGAGVGTANVNPGGVLSYISHI